MYLTLFFGPRLRVISATKANSSSAYLGSALAGYLRRLPALSVISALSGSFLLLVWLSLFVLVWYAGLLGLLLVDASWAEAFGGFVSSLAYY